MKENDLRLLYIDSPMHALVSINQTPVGQTGLTAISQPIADSSDFFISVQPLFSDPGFIYLPYTRRISLLQDAEVFAGDGLISLCLWPDKIAELTLFPLSIYKSQPGEILPSVLSPFEFFISGERHAAFIYNEAGSSFAVEHSGTGRLKYIYPLPFSVLTAELSLTKLGEFPLLYASGKTADDKSYLFVAGILPTFKKQICLLCESFEISSGSVSIVTDENFGQKKTLYAVKDTALEPVSTELGWFTKNTQLPNTDDQACSNLLLAVKMKISKNALECLTPSLAEGLGFSDLCDFFGDFEMSAKPLLPAGKNYGFALKYRQKNGIFNARNFTLETVDSNGRKLIDNITEL